MQTAPIALAYGLLCRMCGDLRYEADALAVAAREELARILTPEERRSGVERAEQMP